MTDNKRIQAQAKAFEASRLSPQYFFENFYKIPIIGQGPSLLQLRPFQHNILSDIRGNSRLIGLKARQIGWTTIAVAYAGWDALFNEEHPWMFVSRTEDAAIKMLNKFKYAYYRLPPWIRTRLPKLKSETQTILSFDNGSSLESVPATASTGRGDSVWGALLDEAGFMEYAEEIWGAVEPLVANEGTAMVFSTANGMGNFFHDIWLDAQHPDSVWYPIFFPWDVTETRDQEWYDQKKRSYRGREWLFFQEYPASPEEAFSKSGRVAFTQDLVLSCFVEIEPYKKYSWTIGGGPREILLHEEAEIEIFQWKPPVVERDDDDRPKWNPNYVVGADIAEGLEHGDFTYITVFDVNTGEQVLSCKTAMPVSYVDELIDWCGREYFTALVIVERNNNGILPLDRLYRDRHYPRLYRMDTFGQFREGDRTARFGWQTTPATKPKMINDFYFALREGIVTLHDPEFLIEAQTFVATGRGSYAATSGNHDDVIMGTSVAFQGYMDSFKYPIMWVDDKVLPVTHEEFDSLFFGNQDQETAIHFLDQPLGRPKFEKIRKSVMFGST